jgi:hypothetical protein
VVSAVSPSVACLGVSLASGSRYAILPGFPAHQRIFDTA